MNPLSKVCYRALALVALGRPGSPFRVLPERLLVVDVARQRLGLLEHATQTRVLSTYATKLYFSRRHAAKQRATPGVSHAQAAGFSAKTSEP